MFIPPIHPQRISSDANAPPRFLFFHFEAHLFNIEDLSNAEIFIINYRDDDRELVVSTVSYFASIKPMIILQEIGRSSEKELPFQYQQNISLVKLRVSFDWDELQHLKKDYYTASKNIKKIEQIAIRRYDEYNKLLDKLENNLQRRIQLHNKIHNIAPGALKCCDRIYNTNYCKSPPERDAIVATFLDIHDHLFEQSSWELSEYKPEIIKMVSKLNKWSSKKYKDELMFRKHECHQGLHSINEATMNYDNVLATKKALCEAYARTEHLKTFLSALQTLDKTREALKLDAKTPVFIIEDWGTPIQVKDTNISFKFDLSMLKDELKNKNHRAAILTPRHSPRGR